MAALRKTYHTAPSIRFATATKQRVIQIMRHKGVTIAELSRRSGIPERTLKRWVSETGNEGPTVPGLSMIADALGVSVHDLMPDARIMAVDEERYQAVSPFYSLPLGHVKFLLAFYRSALQALRRED